MDSLGVGNKQESKLMINPDCACGEVQKDTTTEHKVLTSPGYPKPYCNDLTCDWVLEAQNGARVVVTVTELQTESGDRLEILDGAAHTDGISSDNALGMYEISFWNCPKYYPNEPYYTEIFSGFYYRRIW